MFIIQYDIKYRFTYLFTLNWYVFVHINMYVSVFFPDPVTNVSYEGPSKVIQGQSLQANISCNGR